MHYAQNRLKPVSKSFTILYPEYTGSRYFSLISNNLNFRVFFLQYFALFLTDITQR